MKGEVRRFGLCAGSRQGYVAAVSYNILNDKLVKAGVFGIGMKALDSHPDSSHCQCVSSCHPHLSQIRDSRDILDGRLMESKQFQQMKKMMQQKSSEVGEWGCNKESLDWIIWSCS